MVKSSFKDDDDESYGEKLQAPADFDGPIAHRRCTDVLCSLLLIAVWAAMTGIGIYAVTNGDYRVILYPMDYDGNICGTDYGDIDMSDYRYLFWVNSYSGGVCVKECPTLKGKNVTSDSLTDVYTLITYGGIWQVEGKAELDEDYIQVANYSSAENVAYCDSTKCFPNDDPELSWVSFGVNRGLGYAYYALDTYEVLYRCFGTDEAVERLETITNPQNLANLTGEQLDVDTSVTFWSDLYADLWTAKQYILGFGFCVAVVVGFFYALFLRIPGVLTVMVWGSIFTTIGLIVGAGVYAYTQANKWEDADPQIYSDTSIDAAKIGSYVCFALGFLLLVIMCCLRKQIQLAMACVKATSRAIGSMWALIFFPVVQSAGFIAFMIMFTLYAAYLASLGELQTNTFTFGPLETSVSVRSFEFDDFVERSAWYLLFCFYWTSQFIIAIGEIIVAMSIAKWYFARNKGSIHSGTVWESVCASMWYHCGTAAYGSLIIALIKMVRTLIAKLQKKAKEMDSKIAECCLCCCQCCLWCFEKCVRFINKNAYIQTAIFGTSFCKSAREAFFLILRNAARIGAVTYVSEAIVIIGKLFISSVTTVSSYLYMNEKIGDELNSIVGPVVLIFLMSWFVGEMFMNVFDMGISTILQCFVADEEMFDGEECFADGDLQRWVNKHGEEFHA